MSDQYQLCNRCVMDTTAQNIQFNNEGNCHFCSDFEKNSASVLKKSSEQRESYLNAFLKEVKNSVASNSQYDCIIGVSGGLDSAWALYQAVNLGLKPLAVHMDNGWNSELAVHNIENLVKKLDVDLCTHVIDWEEYRQLMQAFFDADVIDVELLYDNAMLAVNYQYAQKFGIKYILAGTNTSTEGFIMPEGWNWFKYDKKNIFSIYKANGHFKKIVSFPAIGVLDYAKFKVWNKIRWVSFLDLFDYQKKDVLKVLEEELGYRPYPYKHYESVFTRFYQGYILPKKFKVDKRRLHLSTLIMSGQMSREEALQNLESSPYPDEVQLAEDMKFFIKKMNWTEDSLRDYLQRPECSHDLYPSSDSWRQLYRKIKSLLGK